MRKKVVFVNLGNFGSTGTIVNGIAEKAIASGYDVLVCYPNLPINMEKKSRDYIISSNFVRKCNNALGFITGKPGSFAYFSTKRLIKRIIEFDPDIIHLHNVHSSFINYKLFFSYIRESKKKIIWTLHDCWAFTGRCPYFDIVGCNKWRTGCFSCPFPRMYYPQSLFDCSTKMWSFKKRMFVGIDNLSIVTPSNWLASLVANSFLFEYPTWVINNGIDLKVFHPVKSTFRQKHDLIGKTILLGVSFGWNYRKGFDIFLKLAKELPDSFRIVLVGTDDEVDKALPGNVISIHRTQDQRELAEVYSAADLFVNPTREENFPTVNLEALACGTPVLTFNTGGSPEMIDSTCGIVVERNDFDEFKKEILRFPYFDARIEEACLLRAKQFERNRKFEEYISIYENSSHSA